MSTQPYQVRTTYLDGSTTRDMTIQPAGTEPHEALNSYIVRNPELTVDVVRMELLSLDNKVLDSHEFAQESRRAA